MKKKFRLLLSLGCLSVLCLTVAGCNSLTKDEEMAERGYTVSVTYDPNGGKFMNRDGVTIKDYFNPSDYEDENGDGKVDIPLTEPTSADRQTSSSDSISLTKAGHFFAGWYSGRYVKLNDAGKPVDESGNELVEKEDGTYVLASDEKKIVTPAYTYDGYWDFEEDTLGYAAAEHADTDGRYTITLYAGWVPFYEFHYYYESAPNVWTQYGITSFDYKAVNEENSTLFDRDTIWVPDWADGKMGHTHDYANKTAYEFPKLDGKTFESAYTDEGCTQQIADSFEHTGSIDLENCKAVNGVQNIYVKFLDGEYYRIETAKQLSENGNREGIYQILNDLDFTGQTWPAALAYNTFTGKFEAAETVTISNVSLAVSSTSVQYGGLFGRLGAGASVKNVHFENVTFDLKSVNARATEAGFGMFSGMIDDTATVENVTVGGAYKIGPFKVQNAAGYQFALVANGKTDGITATEIGVSMYGQLMGGKYHYYADPDTAKVEGGKILLTFSGAALGIEKTEESITIQ
ncbi:MAG: hypothetical protein IJX81_00760 [Clostridia bacterium]|nr:hypothetical protein [Clostridia bacterium]